MTTHYACRGNKKGVAILHTIDVVNYYFPVVS